jgi:hypothetical protein
MRNQEEYHLQSGSMPMPSTPTAALPTSTTRRRCPTTFLEAHRQNDRSVMQAYGFSTKMTESECVAKLLEMCTAYPITIKGNQNERIGYPL